jgi:4'-phosphopantetheinyl transferase EntD
MNIHEKSLEQRLQGEFLMPLKVAVSNAPFSVNRLAPKEFAAFNEFPSTARRDAWLRGRAALKRLLLRLGQDEDTSGIHFPNARCSLTHSGGCAIAVGVEEARLRGIGVDLETGRTPRLESARFFLDRREQEWCLEFEPSVRSEHLQRLWTVKEALFKADPRNRETGLLDYAIEDPGKSTGRAFATAGKELELAYGSFRFDGGILSMAISRKEALWPLATTNSGC